MTKTKTKPPVIYGDDLPITTHQINTINRNCQWNVGMKEEWVQWVTGDVNRTSLKSLTQAQAVKVIRQQTGEPHPQPLPKGEGSDNWGYFDSKNRQHLTLLAYMRTAQWTTENGKHGEVADIERLSDFLKSDKSPINKPLKNMEPWEVSKIIEAFKGIVKSKYK
ncbi:hypothetical protein [Flavobacterium geliluteum]|uniref:Uncharacterized protein n=1 Tax=Flavobacterium geliluteum TaxID=2816120 RepID=A0A940XHQ1_9FLAO|nr:hypothetical protein [Flavobacterium geliluteum]MBP4139979.1 hypothetical protein [Flavobacterium geliluteum]